MKGMVVAPFKDLLGDALRGVMVGPPGYEVIYTRDDVDFKCSQEELEVIYDEFRAAQLASGHIEDAWQSGNHTCNIMGFEDIRGFKDYFTCHFMEGNSELIIWFDQDAPVEIKDIVDLGKDRVAWIDRVGTDQVLQPEG